MLGVQAKRTGGVIAFEQPRLPGSGHDLASSDLAAGFLLQELLHTYDALGVGLATIDSDGRLLHCNAVADGILAERDGIQLTPSGILRLGARNESLTQALARQSRETQAPDAGGPPMLAILAVPRPSGKRSLTLLTQPSNLALTRADASAAPALLFVIDPESSRTGMEHYARQVYKLTPAETDLASLLTQGKSLAECCSQLEIRRPTVASHLRQLFRKTQTKTQSQLVSLLYRRCGVLCSGTHLTIRPQAALHLVDRTIRQEKSFISQKGMQTHSFGGRQ